MKTFVRVLCAVMLLSVSSCINDEADEVEEVVTSGAMLPDFAVTMHDGSTLTGEELRRVVSVVMFFHTGCPDCRAALPRVQQLYDTYAAQGVMFALISREEEATSVAAYWEEQGFTMPYSAQTDRKVYELFARKRVPRIYISERGGVVRHIFTDNPVPDYDTLVGAIEGLNPLL